MIKLSLKAARVNVGYTQEFVAEYVGVTVGTVHNWETGKSFPNAPQIDKICELFGLSYDNLNFLPNNSLKANRKEK